MKVTTSLLLADPLELIYDNVGISSSEKAQLQKTSEPVPRYNNEFPHCSYSFINGKGHAEMDKKDKINSIYLFLFNFRNISFI